jgi:bifunctional DNA-binding transcriptional regulator/antitoxin component of YhaV-PrlF toxin-antitoxin module
MKIPQLVKGGKYIFGWSKVSENGKIKIPPETCDEYGFKSGDRVLITSGSKTSGGFSLIKIDSFLNSSLASIRNEIPAIFNFELSVGEILFHKNRNYCWSKIEENCIIHLPITSLEKFGINSGDKLLVGRGSGLGPAFLIKGLIIEEALKHNNLGVF